MRPHPLVAIAVLTACHGFESSPTGHQPGATTSAGEATTLIAAPASESTGAAAPTSSTTHGGSTQGSSTSSTDDVPIDPRHDAEPPFDPPPCDPFEHCTTPDEDGACRHALTLDDGMQLHYWSNLALAPADDAGGCHAQIERVVVVVHGTSRNPWSYMQDILDTAVAAGADTRTLVVAPRFPSASDDAEDDTHVWDPGGSGWKTGDASLTDPPTSSFTALDRLLLEVMEAEHFPALARIVVTGHSAGGQFVQRYAVATDVDATSPVPLRFVPLNPSSWLYLDPWRWDGEDAPPGVAFVLPFGTDCDDTYDDYKYGLADVPPEHYIATHADGIPLEYLARDVVVLLGEDDVENDDDLDTSCPAALQGEHRRERGLVYLDHLDARFPEHTHVLATVPDVGHDHTAMYASAAALAALFDVVAFRSSGAASRGAR
jgi:hypothetical protein